MSVEEQLPWPSALSQSPHRAKFICCLLPLRHVALPTIPREGSAKGLPGQSVTLSQFRPWSALKGALVLTLAPLEVSNGWDGTFQPLLRASHLPASSTLPSLLSSHATGSVRVAPVGRVKIDGRFEGEPSRKEARIQAGPEPGPGGDR